MSKAALSIIIALAVLLAACQRSPATLESENLPAVIPTSPSADLDAGPATKMANCTVASDPLATSLEEDSLFPPVAESDWVKGPQDAKVTLVEYSDFQ